MTPWKSNSSINANGHTTSYTYDAANRLASVRGADSAVTTYARDSMGSIVSRTDPNGHITAYNFDLDERLIDTASPLGRHWTSTYDPEGHRISLEDPRGYAAIDPSTGTTTYAYDALGRLTGIDYGDATPDVTYSFDAAGQVVAMEDAQGIDGLEGYTVDNLGRRTAVIRDGKTISYGYDAVGRVTNRTYPTRIKEPFVEGFSYDADGRIQSETMNGGAVATYAYDAAGNPVTRTFGNGVVESRTYDRVGRVLSIVHTLGATLLGQFAYTYDAAGNRLSETNSSGTQTYTYDGAERLTGICYTAACTEPDSFIHYTYDGAGNRLTETRSSGTTTYVYDADDELIQSTAPGGIVTNYAYDPAGNEVQNGEASYTYDLANRLIAVGGQLKPFTYAYDGNGRRLTVSRTGASKPSKRFLWDTNGPLATLTLELKSSGAESRRFVHGMGPLAFGKKTKLTYYGQDALGSVRLATKKNGALAGTAAYEPFGSDRLHLHGALGKNPLRFTGEYFDLGTGLYDLRARQYTATTGRFLSRDPVVGRPDEPATSSYVYVSDRPTILVDPSGEKYEDCPYGYVCVWEHSYYGGGMAKFHGGFVYNFNGPPPCSGRSPCYVPPRYPFNNGVPINDHISSIRNNTGWVALFWPNKGYQAKQINAYDTDPPRLTVNPWHALKDLSQAPGFWFHHPFYDTWLYDKGGWNDTISSYRVESGQWCRNY